MLMFKFLLLTLLFTSTNSTQKLNKYRCNNQCQFNNFKEVEIKLDYYKNNPSKFKIYF
jgi:hypothetical protein